MVPAAGGMYEPLFSCKDVVATLLMLAPFGVVKRVTEAPRPLVMTSSTLAQEAPRSCTNWSVTLDAAYRVVLAELHVNVLVKEAAGRDGIAALRGVRGPSAESLAFRKRGHESWEKPARTKRGTWWARTSR